MCGYVWCGVIVCVQGHEYVCVHMCGLCEDVICTCDMQGACVVSTCVCVCSC